MTTTSVNLKDEYNNTEIQSILDIKTFYEEKWLEEGKKIKYVSFRINQSTNKM